MCSVFEYSRLGLIIPNGYLLGVDCNKWRRYRLGSLGKTGGIEAE